jgi:hypothetical protein
MLFEVPAVSVTEIKAFKQGMMRNQDMLDLRFAPGNFAPQALLHIFYEDCNAWQKWITLVKTHEIDSDRVLAVDKAAMEKAKSSKKQSAGVKKVKRIDQEREDILTRTLEKKAPTR